MTRRIRIVVSSTGFTSVIAIEMAFLIVPTAMEMAFAIARTGVRTIRSATEPAKVPIEPDRSAKTIGRTPLASRFRTGRQVMLSRPPLICSTERDIDN
jgi:hypothetical protein